MFGAKVYVRIDGLKKSNKMASHAHIGYLVGYQSYNIWHIWLPASGKVISVRDVQFDQVCLDWHFI